MLIDRAARLGASEDWADNLNPAQRAALAYLAQANRFSRAPSHVADWLGATRGTVSQTLRALDAKGLITSTRGDEDKRAIRYDLTEAGQMAAARVTGLDRALAQLSDEHRKALELALGSALRGLLRERDGRAFGVCRTCRHHQAAPDGGYCDLLNVQLAASETVELCHEHAAG